MNKAKNKHDIRLIKIIDKGLNEKLKNSDNIDDYYITNYDIII